MPQINLDVSDDLLERIEMTAKTAGLTVEELLQGHLGELFDSSQPDFFKFATPDNLSSEKEVDYSILRFYLKNGNWEEADYQTYLAVLKCYGLIEGQKLLDIKHEGQSHEIMLKLAESFPITDLKTINQLWLKYSQGKFGFSVHKKLLIKLNGSLSGDLKLFYTTVGWIIEKQSEGQSGHKFSEYLNYNNLNFKSDSPPGHLPSYRFFSHHCEVWMRFLPFFLQFSVKQGL
jgi:hypothetical protein